MDKYSLTFPISVGPVCVLDDVCTGQTKVSYFYLLIRAMKKNISRLQISIEINSVFLKQAVKTSDLLSARHGGLHP